MYSSLNLAPAVVGHSFSSLRIESKQDLLKLKSAEPGFFLICRVAQQVALQLSKYKIIWALFINKSATACFAAA